MRREDRRKKQLKHQKFLALFLLTFMLVIGLTFCIMKIFNNRKLSETAPVQLIEKSHETKDSIRSISEQRESTTEEKVIESPSEPKTKSLDDSELMSNAAKVSYGVYYFNDETYVSNHKNEPMISASVIKVFIMEYIYQKNLETQTTTSGETLDTLIQRMIQTSDNEATNTIIDHFGMDTLNTYFKENGYLNTQLQRKMLDEQARSMGKENCTSLDDAMSFLKKVYQNKDQAPYSTILEVMQGQQIKTKIPSKLPDTIKVANKTGELSSVENDIGLVMAENNPFAIVILSDGVTDSGKLRSAIGDFTLTALNE